MFGTVRGRLSLINSLVVLLALAVSGALLYSQMDAHFARRDRNLTAARLESVVRILSENPDVDREWLLGVLGDLAGLRLEMLPAEAVTGTPGIGTPGTATPVGAAAAPAPEGRVRLDQARQPSRAPSPEAERIRALVQDRTVIGYVRADNLMPERELARWAVLRNLALVALPAFLAAVAAGGLLGLGIARPLGRLTETAARMGAGALSARAPLAGPAEIQTLAAQLNRMAADLEQAFAAVVQERERLKRLISDLSHELKTPLTALRTFNELMAEGPDPLYIAESRRQLGRLQWLVQTLLDLSRLDAGFIQLTPRREPLQAVVDRVVSALAPLGRERGVTVAPAGDFAAAARYDGRWLEQALTNLVDNAIKFSPPGGQVSVGVRHRPGAVGLEVRDQGPGIAPALQGRVFERFYRGPDQPSGAGPGGAGLGLAVVVAVARAHGGEVSLESEPGQGAAFTIWLPADG